ncbi:carbohydrate ABC transporter permease [Streptomyces acidiscabies]|uniref:Sugar ABC transporter permease n=1 Tax=Streptomyces acidiscabies TaxID=42234 RepID=A0AAP6EDT1_9ACTN|nr:sugar ABC transporter permease [Streptomyces acidiscabies]MBP5941598.1 sugar ABC transporter permease [Streptomyces sp. LBUM 1476]MBZ3912991.1 sugar ABC transporter permease [Streptomyces acidiscabies]MDX2958476.1 sugar ABC transporter permease [Streptomyces acidiscabies]MDX3021018.1 sugar ABC transporter permease [Streptomyces acidiscabies]MDX3794979.1 sugar ABC transporter permease [Streptomyces acidiscabies]
MTATTPTPVRRARGISKRSVLPWVFLAPGLLLALVFKFWPMAKGIWLSFFKVRPFLGDQWVGLDNYTRVLSDHRFQDAVGHTLTLGLGQSVGGILVGFALALLLEGQSRSLKIVRTAVFLPVVTATAVVGELWRLMYYPTSDGLLNHGLGFLGLGPTQFLDNPGTALWSTMAMGIWMAAPYNMVIILAGLAGVDRSQYEAAAMDGVSLWQRLRYITIPAIRPAIGIVLTLAAIRGLRVFTEVYVLTGGGPAGSTEVWMTRAYTLGFTRNDIGGASAASVVLLCVTLLLTVTVNYFRKRGDAR